LGFNDSFGLDESHLISSAANIAGCSIDLKCQLGMNSVVRLGCLQSGRNWIIVTKVVLLTAPKGQFPGD
jgi:carbonic anhydrase/acetyltransferase-like protein (isoleucine patch superfamily)